jgi:hypothetical protein
MIVPAVLTTTASVWVSERNPDSLPGYATGCDFPDGIIGRTPHGALSNGVRSGRWLDLRPAGRGSYSGSPGAPVTLALQASGRHTQTTILRVLHHPIVEIITNPLVVLFFFSVTG